MKQREDRILAANLPYNKEQLPEAVDRLVRFYEGWGRPDEAAKWRAERAKYSVSSPAPPPMK
jgi:hypothetical protein